MVCGSNNLHTLDYGQNSKLIYQLYSYKTREQIQHVYEPVLYNYHYYFIIINTIISTSIIIKVYTLQNNQSLTKYWVVTPKQSLLYN